MAWWGIVGLGASFGSGYMICVSSWVLWDGVLHILYALGHWTLRQELLESGSSFFAVWVYSSRVGCACVLRSVSLRQPLEEFPLRRRFARAVRTWKLDTSPLPSFFQPFSVLGVACGVQRIGFIGTRALLGSTVITCSSGGFGLIFHIFYVAVNSNSEAFVLHSRRMEKCAQPMLLVAASLSAVRTLTLDIISRALYMAVCGNFRCVVQHFSGPSMMAKSSSSRAPAN